MSALDVNIGAVKNNLKNMDKLSEPVLIVAATKTIETDRIRELEKYGIFDIGENRVQELLEKYEKLPDFRWHFIGALQKNKVKYIVDKVVLIHSVDSVGLADEINKRAAKIKKAVDILVEVNIGREPNKSGIYVEDLVSLCEYISRLEWVKVRGLMAVMPVNAKESIYMSMQECFLDIKSRYGESISFLSMGMSGDYEIALRHGANIIRLGTAIFGERKYSTKL